MEVNIKKRIMGAVVLIIFGILVLPWLLQNKTPTKSAESAQTVIPAPLPPVAPTTTTQTNATTQMGALDNTTPATTAVGIATPQKIIKPVVLQDTNLTTPNRLVLPAKHKPVSNKTDNQSTAKPEKKLTHLTTNNSVKNLTDQLIMSPAWEVQLGSFANAANAAALVKHLDAQGIKSAHTQSVQGAQGTLVRVVIGPFLKRAKAHAIQQQIKHELHISGKITCLSTKPTSK